MIDGRSFFGQPVKNNLRTYDNILKIATGQEMITQLVVFTALYLFQKLLQDESCRFK